jgi:hypothetical protein
MELDNLIASLDADMEGETFNPLALGGGERFEEDVSGPEVLSNFSDPSDGAELSDGVAESVYKNAGSYWRETLEGREDMRLHTDSDDENSSK